MAGINPQMIQALMAHLGQGGGQGAMQGGGTNPAANGAAMQQPNPPAQIDPKALMALLTYIAQTKGGVQGQPVPTSATQLQGPQGTQNSLPGLMQQMGQKNPPPEQMQQQQQQQAQQQQQQQMQQQQQANQQLMGLLKALGLHVQG